jgi:hypothetical protein
MKKYKEEEQQTPLWIRVEASRSRDVINNHHSLSLNRDIDPRWTSKQREVISDLDDTLRLLGKVVAESCHRRWHFFASWLENQRTSLSKHIVSFPPQNTMV